MTPAEPVAAVPTDAALIAAWRGGDEPAAARAGPGAAAPDATRGVPAAGSAGVRVRRDRRGAWDDARRGPRALSPCGETIEGAHEMNDDVTLHDDKLQEVARRLGARAAERLDVERTAEAVVARLRTEPRAEVRVLGWIQPAWLRIAAVLVR